jgi:hypothetical protein
MRKVSGLVLLGAVLVPLSLAQAAEVMRLPANNAMANAISTDPATGATAGIFVTREKGTQGGPVDRIFFIISAPSGEFLAGGGVLPKGAFHADAHSASLDIDIHDVPLDFSAGEIPADGVISVDWQVTNTTRDSGVTKLQFDNVTVNFVGTRATSGADVDGEIFGAGLIAPTGDLTYIHQATIIITKD